MKLAFLLVAAVAAAGDYTPPVVLMKSRKKSLIPSPNKSKKLLPTPRQLPPRRWHLANGIMHTAYNAGAGVKCTDARHTCKCALCVIIVSIIV